jgi:hypothetical protein
MLEKRRLSEMMSEVNKRCQVEPRKMGALFDILAEKQ